MNLSLSAHPFREIETDLLVVPAFGSIKGQPAVAQLDRAVAGLLHAEIERLGFAAGQEEELLFQTHGALAAGAVLLIGCGKLAGPASWQRVADAASRRAKERRAKRVAVVLGAQASAESVGALAEGILLAAYRFDRFRSKPRPEPDIELTLAVKRADASLARALERGRIRAEATCLARDLTNTPAGALPPRELARIAEKLAGPRLSVTVHGRKSLERLGMGALLGVGQGSAQPPAFIELLYQPKRRAKHTVALIGKGITFDSGGLSLKTADAMQAQKRDMAGGGVVIAVLSALPGLDLPIEVRGYVPAAENMPSGSALRPGDVLRAFDGKTIEILNTDAEGRLVLADALAYAASRKPDVMIDLATLTAAVRSALGSRYAAILGTDRTLIRAWLRAAAEAGEKLWELPLAGEYRKDLDSRIADLKNVGEGQAGTIVGGLFLREFTAGVPWAHIDFSSTVLSDGHPCHPKGASGFGVRTALRYLERLSED
jgi:leucyl aminopeptidase